MVSAASWSFDQADKHELAAPANADVHLLTCWLKGTIHNELYLDGRQRHASSMGAGQMNLVRAGESPRSINRDAHGECLVLFIPDGLLRSGIDPDQPAQAVELLPLRIERDLRLDDLSRAISREMRFPGLASRLMIESAGLAICTQLVRRWSNLAGTRATRQPTARLAPNMVRRVQDRICDRLDDDIALTSLASEAGLSASHLCKAFRDATGLPPHRWLIERRIERARELLASTELPISDVAARVGYDDPSYFARLFKRQTGTTPLAYRQERRT